VWRGAERHPECVASTTTRKALSCPIVSAGWLARGSGRPASAEGGAERKSHSICPPDGVLPSGGLQDLGGGAPYSTEETLANGEVSG
jgi:hypothetical protein